VFSNEVYAQRSPLDFKFDQGQNTTQSLQIRPNPFTKNTNFDLNLLQSQTVRLSLFDSKGTLVQTQFFEAQKGQQTLNFEGKNLAIGLYFYRLVADNLLFSGILVKE
jgi:Secretion system C-terminal sorting domain